MPEGGRFKLAFPSVTLPANRGGRRGALIFSVSDPRDSNIAFGWVIDETGTIHQQVPFAVRELMGAKPMVLVEDPNAEAPKVGGGGSGLVGPTGQRL